MKFAQAVVEAIKASKAGLSVLLMGSPGKGKTSVAKRLAKVLKLRYVEVRPAEFEAVDFRGIPSIENGRTRWNVPDFWPSEACVLNVDEITQAPMELTSPLLKLFLGGAIGDYELPAGTILMATGNSVSDRAGCSRLSSALRERCVVINLESDYTEWRTWATEEGKIENLLLAFLDANPALFDRWDPKLDHNQPTPRNWARVSAILPYDPAEETIAGIIGADVAAMLMKFIRANVEIPNPISVWSGVKEFPKSPALMAKFVEKLAEFAVENVETEYRSVGVDLAQRFPAECYTVQFLLSVAKLNGEVLKRPEFKAVVAKHRAAIIAGRKQ